MSNRLVVLSTRQGCHIPFNDLFDRILFFPSVEDLQKGDILLFEGGTDVNPHLYGEEPIRECGMPDVRRDAFETVMFRKAVKARIPMLGICRGSQFLNVMNGGKLHQHIGVKHCETHEVKTKEGLFFPVTSTHHQMWIPTVEMDLIASAKLMDKYDLEPEIGFYPKTKSLLIQGHPEYLHKGHPFWDYSVNLVKKHLLGGK